EVQGRRPDRRPLPRGGRQETVEWPGGTRQPQDAPILRCARGGSSPGGEGGAATRVTYCCPPAADGAGQETGAAWVGARAVQGFGRSGAVTPAGSRNSATGVTGRLEAPRPAPPRPAGAGGGGMVAAEQRGTIWSALAKA